MHVCLLVVRARRLLRLLVGLLRGLVLWGSSGSSFCVFWFCGCCLRFVGLVRSLRRVRGWRLGSRRFRCRFGVSVWCVRFGLSWRWR